MLFIINGSFSFLTRFGVYYLGFFHYEVHLTIWIQVIGLLSLSKNIIFNFNMDISDEVLKEKTFNKLCLAAEYYKSLNPVISRHYA